MWENPQGFQSNYKECSLAQCSVLPVLLLFPREGAGGLGVAASLVTKAVRGGLGVAGLELQHPR